MDNKRTLWIFILAMVGFLLTGCSGTGPVSAQASLGTEIPPVKASAGVVVEGHLVPVESVDLAFVTGGRVNEVLIEEGDQVNKGEVLALLGNREVLEAEIARVELDLFNAAQELEKLNEDLELSRAEAFQAIMRAYESLREAKQTLYYFDESSTIADLGYMEAIDVTGERLDQAREAYEPYKHKTEWDYFHRKTLRRKADKLKDQLEWSQHDYSSAIRRMQLEGNLMTAQAEIEKTKQDYAELANGPDPDQVAAIQERIKATEAALKGARAQLDNLELVAPISGTVVDLNLITGEQVAPNQAVVVIADFSGWYVETEDLTEIDVVELAIGQSVEIIPDALPETELSGVVDSISKMCEEKRGDITYTVKVLVDEIDPRLRWGMTATVRFK